MKTWDMFDVAATNTELVSILNGLEADGYSVKEIIYIGPDSTESYHYKIIYTVDNVMED